MDQISGSVDVESTALFASELGWIAAWWRGEALLSLSIGHAAAAAAGRALDAADAVLTDLSNDQQQLIARLQRFVSGGCDDFLDVPLYWDDRTVFQQAVLQQCRQIPRGATSSYGQLAERAGYPRSARAVGNVMSNNRTPLIVPCHRVVGAGGAIGGFSAPDGVQLKRRLLALEGVSM